MKEELKTEDIVGYLLYGLTGELGSNCQDDFYDIIASEEDEVKFKKGAIWEYSGYADDRLCIPLGEGSFDGFLMSNENTYACFTGCCVVYPKLIPLHSLTQDQLVHFSICFRLWYDKPNFDYKLMIYQDIETCHKLHVDYRGLIEKGLAIKK